MLCMETLGSDPIFINTINKFYSFTTDDYYLFIARNLAD